MQGSSCKIDTRIQGGKIKYQRPNKHKVLPFVWKETISVIGLRLYLSVLRGNYPHIRVQHQNSPLDRSERKKNNHITRASLCAVFSL